MFLFEFPEILGGTATQVRYQMEFFSFVFSKIFNCFVIQILIYDALRDLVSFVPFKKTWKHPWRTATFSKVAD